MSYAAPVSALIRTYGFRVQKKEKRKKRKRKEKKRKEGRAPVRCTRRTVSF